MIYYNTQLGSGVQQDNREYTVKKAGDAAKGLVIFGTVTAVLYLALTEFPGWIAGR